MGLTEQEYQNSELASNEAFSILAPLKMIMKKFYHLAFALGSAGVLFFAGVDSDNGKAGATGSPGENNCTNCHNTFAANSGPGSIVISSNMTNWEYIPGQTYEISVSLAQTGRSLFGVGFEALLPSGANAGVLTAGAGTTIKTATVAGNSRRNIVHQLNGGASPNSHTFTFTWEAPTTDVGDVTFYCAGNACNDNGANSGDYVYTTSQVISPATVNNIEEESFSAFSSYPNPVIDNLNLNYSLPQSSKVVCIVYDITGKQVHIDQSNRFAGNQQQVLNLSSLNAGTYILSVQLSGQSFTKRFIKK